MKEVFLAESGSLFLKENTEKKPGVKSKSIGPAVTESTIFSWVHNAKDATHYKSNEAAYQAIIRVKVKGGAYSVEKKWIAE